MNEVLTKASYLGPARVLAVEGNRVLVALPEAKAWATPAFAQGYSPVANDVLLVIGQDESFFAIGVLQGRGKTTLTAHGDLELRAPHGSIDLLARDGIRLRAGLVQIAAKTWDAVAETVRQRFHEFRCQVRGVLRWRAARAETDVDEVHRTTAKRIVQRAKEDVSIDGEKIHLG
jgi:hypothetical protein